MKPQGHVIASIGLGALFWGRTKDIRMLLLSLTFGVLLDLDHLIDYFYAERRLHFNLRDFLRSRYWERSGRLFLLLHAFEYLPLIYLFWHAKRGRNWAVAATTAMALHVGADHFVNQLRPLGYFVLYRLFHRFRSDEILDHAAAARLELRLQERRRLAQQGRLPWWDRITSLFC